MLAHLALLTLFVPVPGAQDLQTDSPTAVTPDSVSPERPGQSTKIDFATEVRPILARKCFACHGNDEETQEAGLRLDSFAEATRDRDGFPAVVPGSPEDSELFVRITDEFDPMPPEHAGEGLTTEEIEALRRWIEGGAEYAPHWAFVPPARPEVPQVRDKDRQRDGAHSLHPVDAFVAARHRELGLSFSDQADDYTLIRRLSLDLTGLPPSPELAQAFASSQDPGKYEAAVDSLLASPAYAERWAAVWLDLARYADSSGHGSDPLRQIWRYRDWVIDAFDRNMPFDEFTVHQLAGDLIPEADRDSRLATAFHRNTMTNTEGGTDDEEFRVLAVKDRVNTTMQVWMGLTAGCAECHSHKYDPISHVEYYQLFDLFNQSADADKNDDRPRMASPTPEQAPKYDDLQGRIDAIERALRAPLFADDGAARRASEAALAGRIHHGAGVWAEAAAAADDARSGVRRFVRAEGPTAASPTALRVGGVQSADAVTLWSAPDPGASARAVTVRLELSGAKKILSLAEVEVLGAGGEPIEAPFESATQSSTDHGGEARRAIDGNPSGEWADGSVTHTKTSVDPWWEGRLSSEVAVHGVRVWGRTDSGLARRLDGVRVLLLDASGETVWASAPAPVDPAGNLVVGPATGQRLLLRSLVADGDFSYFEVPKGSVSAKGLLAEVRLEEGSDARGEDELSGLSVAFTAATPLPLFVSERVSSGLGKGRDERTAEEAAAIDAALLKHDPGLAALREEGEKLRGELASMGVPTTPVMEELPAHSRRKTHVLVRGNFLQPGEEVEAGVPAVFPPLPDGVEPDRLALAHWLMSEGNPLTARVAVNRLWSRLFGRGLVLSEGDFGSQAELPTHPKLLDWLAVEFRTNGWDQKALLRTIVTSRTYRQASDVVAGFTEQDPLGTWLSRYPRQRLEAEMVRDHALCAAGVLSSKRFGPSVYPPQPEGLWKAAFNGQRDWKESQGEDRFRRGIYVFLRRTIPYPMLATFDAPSRENCTVQRIPTNTPLQAFVTLNDPVFVEASQALAKRARDMDGSSEREVIRAMLWCALSRPPAESQVDTLLSLFQDARDAFAADPDGARTFAGDAGDTEGVALPERAAWVLVASTVLNLDRALTKE